MKHLPVTPWDVRPATKEEGLRAFQRCGWLLVDATYTPVNEFEDEAGKNAFIIVEYLHLKEDLTSLLKQRSVPLVLIKKNICQILKQKLRDDKFQVLNGDQSFPSRFPVMREKVLIVNSLPS